MEDSKLSLLVAVGLLLSVALIGYGATVFLEDTQGSAVVKEKQKLDSITFKVEGTDRASFGGLDIDMDKKGQVGNFNEQNMRCKTGIDILFQSERVDSGTALQGLGNEKIPELDVNESRIELSGFDAGVSTEELFGGSVMDIKCGTPSATFEYKVFWDKIDFNTSIERVGSTVYYDVLWRNNWKDLDVRGQVVVDGSSFEQKSIQKTFNADLGTSKVTYVIKDVPRTADVRADFDARVFWDSKDAVLRNVEIPEKKDRVLSRTGSQQFSNKEITYEEYMRNSRFNFKQNNINSDSYLVKKLAIKSKFSSRDAPDSWSPENMRRLYIGEIKASDNLMALDKYSGDKNKSRGGGNQSDSGSNGGSATGDFGRSQSSIVVNILAKIEAFILDIFEL